MQTPSTEIKEESPALIIDELVLHRQQHELLSLNETIKGGDILTIMGPSGSGKSTLLNWLTGMLPKGFSATGKLYLNGQHITDTASHLRRIGLLYQDPLLFPHLTVAGNISFAMPAGPKAQRQADISQALAQVGLGGLEQRNVQSLSGGQQARVALLRVLMSQPKAILLDEPFSKLDSQLRQETRQLVFDQIRQYKLPAIMVTHDQTDADAAQGKVIQLT
ncbi:ATP-binding cassette domain-containing protein [Shewanella livingstonensis]|uniref:ATP-binding cassette domain-containing protein n=1 Tax=Shewanella livingstonensis TaxID=150120 RepID=A0A3G8LYX2_9GAMM|nr:ATP-binding cassette domain-containing protein [Shewanella livingstonensis]AZG74295.1 ATP-binding cassette domain-containing protein [Shewanella livingstonensis]